MRYLLGIIGLSLMAACTNFKKPTIIDKQRLDKEVKKSDVLAIDNVKSVLDTMSGERLYIEIRKRFGKGCYQIEHIKNAKMSSVGFCNIPNFYISKNESGQVIFSLDTTQTSVFTLYDKMPFAMMEIFKFKDVRFVDLIQGADSIKWDLYDSKLKQGYTVFQCKKIIDIGHNKKGNLYLPYIFYTKDNSEIFAYEWIHKKNLTLSDIAKKWLKE